MEQDRIAVLVGHLAGIYPQTQRDFPACQSGPRTFQECPAAPIIFTNDPIGQKIEVLLHLISHRPPHVEWSLGRSNLEEGAFACFGQIDRRIQIKARPR